MFVLSTSSACPPPARNGNEASVGSQCMRGASTAMRAEPCICVENAQTLARVVLSHGPFIGIGKTDHIFLVQSP